MAEPTVVEVRDVRVTYGTVDALADAELRVARGERVALIGSSGAGKTTVLDLVSGLVAPTRGTVRVLGEEPGTLAGRRLRAHRRRVGIIGQHLDMALPLRVVHNVNAGHLGVWSTPAAAWSLVRPRDRDETFEILERVGLGDRLFSRTDELSGGERQRVAVARVLAQCPDLVVADEPTSSIDPRLSDHVMDLLCGPDERAPWTTVVSVHDPDLARRHATRIVGLRGGRIVFDGPPGSIADAELADLYRAHV